MYINETGGAERFAVLKSLSSKFVFPNISAIKIIPYNVLT